MKYVFVDRIGLIFLFRASTFHILFAWNVFRLTVFLLFWKYFALFFNANDDDTDDDDDDDHYDFAWFRLRAAMFGILTPGHCSQCSY